MFDIWPVTQPLANVAMTITVPRTAVASALQITEVESVIQYIVPMRMSNSRADQEITAAEAPRCSMQHKGRVGCHVKVTANQVAPAR